MTIAEKYEGLEFKNKNNETYIVKQYINAKTVLVLFPETNTEKWAKMGHIKDGNVKNPIHGSKNPAISKNRIGTKNTNKKLLEATIIEQNGNKVKIRFTETKYEKWVKVDDFMHNDFMDNMHKSVFERGYLGEHDNEDYFHKKTYRLWVDMMKRCYSSSSVNNWTKAYAEVEVSKEWFCYATFQKDIKNLIGFFEWSIHDDYELDKDKGSGIKKIYSIETCEFIKHSENVKLRKNIEKDLSSQ